MISRTTDQRRQIAQLLQSIHMPLAEQAWPIRPDLGFFQVAENAWDAVTQLAATFSQSELIASRIAIRDVEDRCNLNPRLAPGTGPILPLRETPESDPYDLLLPDGLLLTDELPALALLHDYRVTETLQNSGGIILVVPTMQDVVIAASLGIAAVPLLGFDRLTLSELRQIEHLVGNLPVPLLESVVVTAEAPAADQPDTSRQVGPPLPQYSEHSSVDSPDAQCAVSCQRELGPSSASLPPAEWLLAEWSFALLERVPLAHLLPITRHLQQAQSYLNLDFSGLAVWMPSDSDLSRLQFCWSIEDRDALRRAVLDSLEASSFQLGALEAAAAARRLPASFLEARQAVWLNVALAEDRHEERRRLFELYAQFVQRQLMPLLDAAAGANDPITATLQFEFANVANLLQTQAPSLHQEIFHRSSPSGSRDGTDRFQGLQQQLQLVDRLIKLAREIRR